MKRLELEHVIRAAGSIADSRELVIVGSQAILGSFPGAPPELTVSSEVDLFPLSAPERADLIDGSIGEKSLFHETFGYYGHGVSPATAVLPSNWRTRLVPVKTENTMGIIGFCLSPVDLAISKLAAGREKDMEFVTAMLRHKLLNCGDVVRLIPDVEPGRQKLITERLERCATKLGLSTAQLR